MYYLFFFFNLYVFIIAYFYIEGRKLVLPFTQTTAKQTEEKVTLALSCFLEIDITVKLYVFPKDVFKHCVINMFTSFGQHSSLCFWY